MAALLLALIAACGSGASDRTDRKGAQQATGRRAGEQKGKGKKTKAKAKADTVPAATAVVTLRLAEPLATLERSAAAVSAVAPDVVYTINDSGHDADLFAFDTTGAHRGRWTIRGARNRDWEALAVGVCGERGAARAASCVYVGDVGDNERQRTALEIYRIAEPLGRAGGTRGALQSTVLSVRFSDRAHNVEAMYVAADGAIILITKVSGHLVGVDDERPRLYRIPASAWTDGTSATAGTSAIAALVDSLPEFPGGGRKRMVTDAARSADGRFLAVRTYTWVATFPLDSASGLPRRGVAPALCALDALAERQGEGVGFLGGSGGRVVLTSEGGEEPLRLATCPVPMR
jgi:hypothetical protein